MTLIESTLTRLFQKHRVIFWYDAAQELRSEFEVIEIDGVEKIEILNNTFGLKHHLLKEAPERKFLLYQAGQQPKDLDNWLLDVQLANGVFSADQVSLWMAEIGLRIDLLEVVQDLAEFFRDDSRRALLKNLISDDDSPDGLRLKMLAVCISPDTEPRMESILLDLLDELSEGNNEKIDLINSCGLNTFLWKKVKNNFNYFSDSPGLLDFSIDLFKSCFSIVLNEHAELNKDALIFIKSWKDSIKYRKSFIKISAKVAELINIEQEIQHLDYKDLIEIDFFRIIDQKILHDLVKQVSDRTISQGECQNFIWRRRRTFWFQDFKDIYEAVDFGSKFIAGLDQADLAIQSLVDGINKYQSTWYLLDFYYRKFIFHMRSSKQVTVLKPLTNMVEQLYSNNYLLKVNDNFQQTIDQSKKWDFLPFPLQREFFNRYIKENLNIKIAIIVSDALRYEIGVELRQLIESEDRFQSEIEVMVSMLPSYTALGMAALMPNNDLSIMPDGTVQVNGKSSQGIENRNKLLQSEIVSESVAIRASDLLSMNQNESRELVKANQVIYVFHNQIDAMGDKTETEERVFEATENALKELVDIIKKLANANVTNMIITSDHGFIYQDHTVDASDFAGEEVDGEEIYIRSRRFAVGKNLKLNKSMKTFTGEELGLVGEYQIQIPKSINRLRLQGSGIRYVHGGAALQEIVLPVIKINKKRVSDTEKVSVEVIASSSTLITSGQLSVAFYQKDAVSAKIQPRQLLTGIYAQDGTLISDEHLLKFDLSSENIREREIKVRFILSQKAAEFNNQSVYLKLWELIPNTAKYFEYKSISFQLKRSISSDFDF